MKKIVLLLLSVMCFAYSAFADIKELKGLEKKFDSELNKKNYKKAIEISLKIIEKSKKENALSFYAVHNKNLGEIYLYNTKEYEKAWNAFIEASTYYNPISFMRLSEMSFNGLYVKKEPDFALVLLGLAIDSLRVNRDPSIWSKKVNEQDEVGEVLISLTQLISNIYTQHKGLIQDNSMAMGYVYELCIEGTVDSENKDRVYCDSKTAVDYFNKAFNEGDKKSYFSSYAEYKVVEMILRYKSAIYNTYLDANIKEEAELKKRDILNFMAISMSTNEIPLTYVAMGLQFEEFGDIENAKKMYMKAFANGLIEQSYDLFNKLDTKK